MNRYENLQQLKRMNICRQSMDTVNEQQRCKICDMTQRVEYTVPGHVWERVIRDPGLIVCLECFFRIAAHRGLLDSELGVEIIAPTCMKLRQRP